MARLVENDFSRQHLERLKKYGTINKEKTEIQQKEANWVKMTLLNWQENKYSSNDWKQID